MLLNVLSDTRDNLFEGCVVCVTGATEEEERKVKEMVETYGGLYVPIMKLEMCSHLLVWKAEGTCNSHYQHSDHTAIY